MAPVTAFIALGSNLGDRAGNLRRALVRLSEHPEIRMADVSVFHETEPVGEADQGLFLNAAVRLETTLAPDALLAVCLEIERSLGRVRDPVRRWGPRTLDLDILFYGDRVIETETLTIPHPRLQERAFVLVPLSEIAPDWRHPVSGRTVREMLAALTAQEAIM